MPILPIDWTGPRDGFPDTLRAGTGNGDPGRSRVMDAFDRGINNLVGRRKLSSGGIWYFDTDKFDAIYGTVLTRCIWYHMLPQEAYSEVAYFHFYYKTNSNENIVKLVIKSDVEARTYDNIAGNEIGVRSNDFEIVIGDGTTNDYSDPADGAAGDHGIHVIKIDLTVRNDAFVGASENPGLTVFSARLSPEPATEIFT